MVETVSLNPNQPTRSKKKTITIIIGIVLVVTAVVGGFLILIQPKKTSEIKVTVANKEKEPTPTEEPNIDKKSVKIQVLNGTGTPGQAGSVVDALKETYREDNIETGNASDYDNKVTTIATKAGFESIAKDIKQTLSGTFDDIKINSSQSLSSDNEYDVIITTGGKKYEEEETTSTPSPKVTSASESPTPTPTTEVTSTPTPTPTP